MIESIPHPPTAEMADFIERSSRVRELHLEALASRMSTGPVIPAFFLLTQNSANAIVEKEARDGYRLLSKGSTSAEEDVYKALREWCEQNGYHETT